MTILLWVFEHYRGPYFSNQPTEELLDHLLRNFRSESRFLRWFWKVSEVDI